MNQPSFENPPKVHWEAQKRDPQISKKWWKSKIKRIWTGLSKWHSVNRAANRTMVSKNSIKIGKEEKWWKIKTKRIWIQCQQCSQQNHVLWLLECPCFCWLSCWDHPVGDIKSLQKPPMSLATLYSLTAKPWSSGPGFKLISIYPECLFLIVEEQEVSTVQPTEPWTVALQMSMFLLALLLRPPCRWIWHHQESLKIDHRLTHSLAHLNILLWWLCYWTLEWWKKKQKNLDRIFIKITRCQQCSQQNHGQ